MRINVPRSCIIIEILSSQAYVYITQQKRPSLLVGDDAIIRKVRIGGWRANDDEHIITACAAHRRYTLLENGIASHITRHTLCTHVYRHPSCRLETRRHSIVIIYHYTRGKTRSINPCRVQLRYYWFMHCDVATAVKGDLSCTLCCVTALEINPRALAREPEIQWKKKCRLFILYVLYLSGSEISGAIRSHTRNNMQWQIIWRACKMLTKRLKFEGFAASRKSFDWLFRSSDI